MPTKTRKHHRRREAPPPTPEVTVQIDAERALTPQQQAAWDWFVTQVRARIARRRQQESEVPDARER